MLVITDVVPGERASGEVRLAAFCRLLAEQGQVTVLAMDRGEDEPDAARVAELGVGGIRVAPGSGASALRSTLAARPYDLIVVEFWHVAERCLSMIRRLQPRAQVAVDTVDLHFLREERAARISDDWQRGRDDRRARELAVYRSADRRVFVSGSELDHCLALGVAKPGDVVVPNIHERRERRVGQRDETAVFVGNFWHAPNVDAVMWLVDKVWPLVRLARPSARLIVAGSRIDQRLRADLSAGGADVAGWVEDVPALHDEAAVAVAPLRFGAGMKGKVSQALAAATPMVVTTVAAEGLDLRNGTDVVVADDAQAFADGIVSLLSDSDMGAALGRSGRQRVLDRCGPVAVRPAVRTLVEEAARYEVGPFWYIRRLPDRLRATGQPVAAGLRRALRQTRRGRRRDGE